MSVVSEQFIPIEHEVRPDEVFAVRNFSYRHRDAEVPTLRDINFTLAPGELVGLHGTSGSGKTTLLYTMSGLIPHFYKNGAYRGEVSYKGARLQDQANFNKAITEVAYISQNPHEQMFGMTVTDVLAFGMENRNVPRHEMLERIDEIAERVSLNHLLDRDVQTLSGGEAQATIIASRLVTNPSALLFDEVISALDPAATERVKGILQKAREEGVTILLSDSDTAWVGGMVDRTLLLSDGTLAFDGAPEDFLSDPALREVAGIGGAEGVVFSERRVGAPVAAVDQVTFGYGAQPVLEDVSMDIPGESCTAIVGPNGSGKSTLAKLLAGFIEPTAGRVRVNGQQISKLKAAAAVAEVAYLFQRPSQMFSEETVLDELLLSPRALGIAPAASLADFGLGGMDEKSPYELSSGQQQRLAQAATFAINSNLLILDEPTRGQSRQEREQLVRRIAERSDTGKATVLITHDMNLARSAADKVVVMADGQVVQQGLTSEVFGDQALFDRLGFPLP